MVDIQPLRNGAGPHNPEIDHRYPERLGRSDRAVPVEMEKTSDPARANHGSNDWIHFGRGEKLAEPFTCIELR